MCIKALLLTAQRKLCWLSEFHGNVILLRGEGVSNLERTIPPTHHGQLLGPTFLCSLRANVVPPLVSGSHFCFCKKTSFSLPCRLLPLPFMWREGQGPCGLSFC